MSRQSLQVTQDSDRLRRARNDVRRPIRLACLAALHSSGGNPCQVRHTFASTRLIDGANPWYVADQLGHADVEMVFRVYGKFIAAGFQRPGAAGKA